MMQLAVSHPRRWMLMRPIHPCMKKHELCVCVSLCLSVCLFICVCLCVCVCVCVWRGGGVGIGGDYEGVVSEIDWRGGEMEGEEMDKKCVCARDENGVCVCVCA